MNPDAQRANLAEDQAFPDLGITIPKRRGFNSLKAAMSICSRTSVRPHYSRSALLSYYNQVTFYESGRLNGCTLSKIYSW